MASAPVSDTSTARGGGARRVTGHVWWFCPDRGFGWLRDDDGQAWFTTWNELPGDGFRFLQDGLAVTFTADRDHHGPLARTVAIRTPARLAG